MQDRGYLPPLIFISTKKIKGVVNSNKCLINDSYDNIHNYLELIDKQTEEINKTKESKTKQSKTQSN